MTKLPIWIIGGMALAGLLIGGCQDQSPVQPSEQSGKMALPPGLSKIPTGSVGSSGTSSGGIASGPVSAGSPKPGEPSIQPPQWWSQASAQDAPTPKIPQLGTPEEPTTPLKEWEKPTPSDVSPESAGKDFPSKGFHPNPLREGGMEPQPLRPDPSRSESPPRKDTQKGGPQGPTGTVHPPLPTPGEPIGPPQGGGGGMALPQHGSTESVPQVPPNPPTDQGHLPGGQGLPGAPAFRGSSSAETPGRSVSKSGSADSARPPFDPYKEYGHFFVGWPKPKLALVLTGARNGYIEPCGCAGKDRMKGGISRLHSMILELRQKRGWPTVALDVGGISKGTGLQGVLKFHALADAMSKMGYEAVAFGLSDLKYDLGDMIAVASEVDGKPGLFICSNVALLGWDAGFTGKPRLIEAGGLKIGVIALLGREFQNQLLSKEILFEDPEKVARQQAGALRKQCDLLVLLAHASRQESLDLAKKVPMFDLVVTSGGAPEPPAQPQQIEGQKAWLIEVGEKGMYAVVVGLYDDPQQPRRYQRVVLDSRYPDSEAMRQIMVAYQEQLKDLGLTGLGLQPVRHPRQELNGPFVGSKACESCHEPSYKVWKRSGHAKAWQTLVQADPPRHHDPECISCHVVGWNPQKYFPYQGGFWNQEKTPHLVDVGCESCHGAGGHHVDAELGRLGADEAIKQKYRLAVRLPLAEAEKTCLECHDLDNSPDFNFKTYWPKVEHWED